jgi:hypothetical protein
MCGLKRKLLLLSDSDELPDLSVCGTLTTYVPSYTKESIIHENENT